MAQSTTIVKTDHASKYLQQLCKHWAHKLTVEFDPHNGRVEFDEGIVMSATASDDSLTLTIETYDETQIERFQQVIVHHLNRFAFRETLTYDWQ